MSATGKLPHFGIILEIKEDHMLVASTATFKGSSSLIYTENGQEKRVVRNESMKYFLPVSPAKQEAGMLHDQITMTEGESKPKWVYLRWANKFKFKDMNTTRDSVRY